jgi:RNA polymerase sigma factor (sigma-70 family)
MLDDDFADLMARAKAGDPAAVRDFLLRFEPEVRMMVRARLPKKLRTQFDSLDIVQAVWQSFFSDLPQDTPDFLKVEHVHGFLAGVVRNKVFEQHRKLTRTAKYNVPREVVSPDPSPSQAAQASDRLAQLIEGRSPSEVKMITLRREGLTYEEIATHMGVNERTVRRTIESVRSRLEAR